MLLSNSTKFGVLIFVRTYALFAASFHKTYLRKSALYAILLLAPFVSQATPPDGFIQTQIQRPDGNQWNEAVAMTFDPIGRLWVAERGGRIWIVDDEAAISYSMRELLTDEETEVTEAEHGPAALTILAKQVVDLLPEGGRLRSDEHPGM